MLPEIWSGHNVADFVDPDIDEKLRALERDEDAAAAEHERLVRGLRGLKHPPRFQLYALRKGFTKVWGVSICCAVL